MSNIPAVEYAEKKPVFAYSFTSNMDSTPRGADFATALYKDTLYIVYANKHNQLLMYYKDLTGSVSAPLFCQPPVFEHIGDNPFKIRSGSKPTLIAGDDFLILFWTDYASGKLLKSFYHFRPVHFRQLMEEQHNPFEAIKNGTDISGDLLCQSEHWSVSGNVFSEEVTWQYTGKSSGEGGRSPEEEYAPKTAVAGFFKKDKTVVLCWNGDGDRRVYTAELDYSKPIGRISLLSHQFGAIGSPAIASLDNDDLLVAWAGAGRDGIFFSTRHDGLWADQQQIPQSDIKPGTSPAMGTLNNQAILTWMDGRTSSIRCYCWESNSRSFQPLSTFPEKSSGGHSMASNADHCLLAWEDAATAQLHYSTLTEKNMETTACKGAVLVIGSLLWQNDSSDHPGDMLRLKWRIANLTGNPIKVRVPIRYGRLSTADFRTWHGLPSPRPQERDAMSEYANQLHTMVFSKELTADQYGSAYVFRMEQETNTVTEVLDAVKALSRAEGIYTSSKKYFTKLWGAIAVIVNGKSPHSGFIKDIWAQHFVPPKKDKAEVTRETYASWFGMWTSDGDTLVTEPSVIDGQGIMNIHILSDKNLSLFEDKRYKDLDYIITCITVPKAETVTKEFRDAFEDETTIIEYSSYPTPKAIATKAINDRRHYFLNNLRCGITTFQDKEILEFFSIAEATLK